MENWNTGEIRYKNKCWFVEDKWQGFYFENKNSALGLGDNKSSPFSVVIAAASSCPSLMVPAETRRLCWFVAQHDL